MRINNLALDQSNSSREYTFFPDKPITVFCGREADTHLSLAGVLTGSYDRCDIAKDNPAALFVLHGEVEMDWKEYSVCHIYSKNEPHRIGVNFMNGGMRCSAEDTKEYQAKTQLRNADSSNIFSFDPEKNRDLPENRQILENFVGFLLGAREATQDGDDRPLFVYDLFDRLDLAEKTVPWLQELAALGRQVFIAVGENYPTERLTHDSVQIIKINENN